MKETGESGSTKNKTVILLLIILLTLLWFVGEILVSYHWMKVNRYPVQVRNLRYADTVTDAGFKMVVISDLHDHEFGKDNEKLIRCVKEQDPEMIILDGDMLNEDSKSDEVPVRLVKGLAEIAPVYYALGNHELDYIGTAEGKKMQKHPENSELVKDLTDAGACVLEEGYRDVEIGGCKVRIGGMYEYAFALDGDNSAENLTGDVRDFLEEFQNTDRYKIMLCHRPDSFVFGDASDYWKIDLVISGHDHGGQAVGGGDDAAGKAPAVREKLDRVSDGAAVGQRAADVAENAVSQNQHADAGGHTADQKAAAIGKAGDQQYELRAVAVV